MKVGDIYLGGNKIYIVTSLNPLKITTINSSFRVWQDVGTVGDDIRLRNLLPQKTKYLGNIHEKE